MKKIISVILVFTALMSLMIPFSVNALDKVTGLKQTGADETSVSLKWDIVSGADKYIVELSSNNKLFFPKLSSGSPSCKVGGLQPGNLYYVRIRAIRTEKEDAADSYSKTITAVTVPNSITKLRQVDATTSSIKLQWTGAKGATSYKVYKRANNKDKVIATVKSTSCVINGFNNKKNEKFLIFVKSCKKGSTYTASENYGPIKILTHLGSSVINNSKVVLTPARLGKPKVSCPKDKTVKVTNNKVPYAVGAHINVYKYNNSRKPLKTIYTNLCNYNVSGFSYNQFYIVKSRVYTRIPSNSKVKYGAWSTYNYFAFGQAPSLTAVNRKLIVKWGKCDGATNYSVYVSMFPFVGAKKLVTTNKTSATITKVGGMSIIPYKSYYVYVVANKKVGNKVYHSISNPWSFVIAK